MYIHELKDWPRLLWANDRLAGPLASVRLRQGRLIGRMESLGFPLRQEAVLRTLTADVLKSSEIEGEKLDAAERLEYEMTSFLEWFGAPPDIDGVLKAALSHLWFLTVHPFDDGNGRIARAISDMALARSEGNAQRFYSMSAQIEQEREAYYDILEQTQAGGLDVTRWMEWFLGCLGRAIDGAEATLGTVLIKARFWANLRETPLNERQTLVLNRLLDGFAGKLTTTKYAQLTKCSQDTALRDIMFLIERGILHRGPEGGRSTSYELASVV